MATRTIDKIFIVGPTASGKSAMALEIAQKHNGEIICADSRTIYRGLDIATAKPSKEERDQVAHYGIDVVDPDQAYSAAQFQRDAQSWISLINSKDKLAIVVGGTGLYIDGLLYGYEFGKPADEVGRKKLENYSVEALQFIVKKQKIEMPENSRNKRYLIRAIEQGGINRRKSQLLPGSVVIGLKPPKEVLNERIEKRANGMVSSGAIYEAVWLYKTFGSHAPGARAPFYKAFEPYVNGAATLEECLSTFIRLDKQLAKRQLTWFKRNPDIAWFETPEQASEFIHNLLK